MRNDWVVHVRKEVGIACTVHFYHERYPYWLVDADCGSDYWKASRSAIFVAVTGKRRFCVLLFLRTVLPFFIICPKETENLLTFFRCSFDRLHLCLHLQQRPQIFCHHPSALASMSWRPLFLGSWIKIWWRDLPVVSGNFDQESIGEPSRFKTAHLLTSILVILLKNCQIANTRTLLQSTENSH